MVCDEVKGAVGTYLLSRGEKKGGGERRSGNLFISGGRHERKKICTLTHTHLRGSSSEGETKGAHRRLTRLKVRKHHK